MDSSVDLLLRVLEEDRGMVWTRNTSQGKIYEKLDIRLGAEWKPAPNLFYQEIIGRYILTCTSASHSE